MLRISIIYSITFSISSIKIRSSFTILFLDKLIIIHENLVLSMVAVESELFF